MLPPLIKPAAGVWKPPCDPTSLRCWPYDGLRILFVCKIMAFCI